MKKMKRMYVSVLALAALTSPAFAQDGSLDPTFDTDGKVTTLVGSTMDQGRATVIQPDGKILVAGYSNNGSNNDFAVVRYNTDGSPDNSFDTDGMVTTDYAGMDDEAYAIALQADGKIVVVGGSHNGSNMDFMVARYNTDGSPDNTFDTDGKLVTDASGSTDFAYSVAIQADQKIVVCGSSYSGSSDDFSLVRYNTDGTPDNTFDTDGKLMIDINTNSLESALAVTLQPDGKIVAAGWTGDYPSADFALVRITTLGALDNTFDGDGKRTLDVQSSHDLGQAVKIQMDGKILIAGASSMPFSAPFSSVARLNADGSLDNTFDADGKATFDFFAFTPEAITSLAIQTDGKILLAGAKGGGGAGDFLLIRVQDNGALDNSFDGDGYVTTNFGGDDVAMGMAVQSDDKIVLAGYNDFQFAAARYDVNICSFTAGVIFSTTVLTCDVAGADSYQWINCNTGTAIPGETNQVFDPYTMGSYAVVVTFDGCTDTSYCVDFNCLFTPSVTITATDMTADVSPATYQWIDCSSGNVAIPGETNQTFTPPGSGHYRVEIIYNGCADSSHCDEFICTVPVSVTQTGSQLSADVAGATYQWIDCDNGNAAITGETAQTFDPTASGNYAVVVTLNGCTDTSACYEYVCSLPINVTVTDFTLEADVAGATYQWLDCDLGSIEIPGATQQTFAPDHNGFFAVEVTLNGCTDTSACEQINGLGISSSNKTTIRVSPNPTTGLLVVGLGEPIWQGTVRVLAFNGEVVYQQKQFSGSTIELDLSNLQSGVYMLELNLDGTIERIKIQRY